MVAEPWDFGTGGRIILKIMLKRIFYDLTLVKLAKGSAVMFLDDGD
jgi:hypothetical protein